jgi:tRNA-specific 2-thiouridylase
MQKSEVWQEADALGLPAEEMRESQEICFVSHGDYRTFLKEQTALSATPGHFVDQAGTTLGTHQGIQFYTPGQRRGLGIATGERLYVQQVKTASLLSSTCTISDLNILDQRLLTTPITIDCKVRYATPPSPATTTPITGESLTIQFHKPQRALSPGQSAVFYDGDRVLGGGIIDAIETKSSSGPGPSAS